MRKNGSQKIDTKEVIEQIMLRVILMFKSWKFNYFLIEVTQMSLLFIISNNDISHKAKI